MNGFKYRDILLYRIKQTEKELKIHVCGGCFFHDNENASCVKLNCVDNMVYKTKKDLRKNKIEEILK